MKVASFSLLLTVTSCLSLVAEEKVALHAINDATALLAGMEPPHQSDHRLIGGKSWQYHKKTLDSEFGSHEERVLHPMTKWSQAELPADFVKGSTVRYLFSGPDILHALHMFPSADTFVLCGLEPVGEFPDLDQLNSGNSGRAFSEVRNALGEIINFSFFRTKDMKEDLRFATFHGTTPIMMIFLARSGQYIKGVEFLELVDDGTLKSKGAEAKGADAVKITFSPRRVAETKTLYYFSSDLSDGGFPKTGFKTWLEAQPKGNSYLKAASFLMHGSYFKNVREHLLDHSVQIIQDDSGIPFRYFEADQWYVDLFGNYTGPIDLFSQHYQSGLRAAYRTRKKPMDFGTGYKWRKGESNLMRFVRQDAVAELQKKLEAENTAATPKPDEQPAEPEDAPKEPEKASTPSSSGL